MYIYLRDEKKERSKQGQKHDKAKQHSTHKAVTFPKKNELPRVGLEPTTLYTHVHVHVHVAALLNINETAGPVNIMYNA